MIAYEELEKALARWKTRRANGAEAVVAEVVVAAAVVAEVAPEDQPTGPAPVKAEGYQNPDHTGELDLADAEVTEA